MRQSKKAVDYLFPRVRQAALGVFLSEPNKAWYRSDLAHRLDLSPSTLQRELENLTKAGILTQREDGNRTYFRANQECPFFPELQGLLEKTSGLVDVIQDVLKPFQKKIKVAFVFGSVARGAERSESDVDLIVIGEVSLKDLVPSLKKAENRLGRPVNVHTYTEREFAKERENHFLRSVTAAGKIFVIGTADELAEIA